MRWRASCNQLCSVFFFFSISKLLFLLASIFLVVVSCLLCPCPCSECAHPLAEQIDDGSGYIRTHPANNIITYLKFWRMCNNFETFISFSWMWLHHILCLLFMFTVHSVLSRCATVFASLSHSIPFSALLSFWHWALFRSHFSSLCFARQCVQVMCALRTRCHVFHFLACFFHVFHRWNLFTVLSSCIRQLTPRFKRYAKLFAFN